MAPQKSAPELAPTDGSSFGSLGSKHRKARIAGGPVGAFGFWEREEGGGRLDSLRLESGPDSYPSSKSANLQAHTVPLFLATPCRAQSSENIHPLMIPLLPGLAFHVASHFLKRVAIMKSFRGLFRMLPLFR